MVDAVVWRRNLVVVTAVLLFFWLAMSSMVQDSPTMDEQNHLARGLAFLRTGDPRLSLEHPTLVNSLSALPLLTVPDIQLPLDHPSWQKQPPDIYWYVFADQLLWHVNDDVTRMIFLARFPVVLMTLGLALVGYHFARALWGRPSALIAFLLLLFDPNLLANGRYITTDLGGTLFLFLAVFLLWRMWSAAVWNWRRWVWAGLGLGLAFSSKLSTLGFVPVFFVLALLPLYPADAGAWRRLGACQRHAPTAQSRYVMFFRGAGRRVLQLVSAGLFSLLVIWALFGFEWGQFIFPSDKLSFLNQLQGPMPTFWAGIDQIVNVSRGGRAAFLLGNYSNEGFLLYFPIAFLVKSPLIVLLLLPITAVLLLVHKPTRKNALFLLIPALYYFGLSMWSGVNIGYRHLLPMLPFLLLLISGLMAVDVKWQIRRVSVTHWLAGTAVAGVLAATLFIHPHYLSYFNLAAGGPKNGPSILADSNVDWGQDLLRLQKWMKENDVQSVKLGWFGIGDPAYYGLNYEPMPGFPRAEFFTLWSDPPFNPQQPEPGIYAISASSLWESHWGEKVVYSWFRTREPDARIGYSILIYEVE